MTIGELAKLFNEEKHIDADLTVIPMRGWLRGDWFDSTGATWINPSPNLRSLEEATLYPGVALIESTAFRSVAEPICPSSSSARPTSSTGSWPDTSTRATFPACASCPPGSLRLPVRMLAATASA